MTRMTRYSARPCRPLPGRRVADLTGREGDDTVSWGPPRPGQPVPIVAVADHDPASGSASSERSSEASRKHTGYTVSPSYCMASSGACTQISRSSGPQMLSALGYAMVARADGNGAEVGGVSQDVMDLFSSRAVAVTGELTKLALHERQRSHLQVPSSAATCIVCPIWRSPQQCF